MKKRFLLTTFYIGMLTLNCFAQQNQIASLLNLIKTDKADTTNLLHLNKLAQEYNRIQSYEKALLQGNYALKLGNLLLEETSNTIIKLAIRKAETSSYNNIGDAYYYQSNFPEALKNYSACLKIMGAIGDKKGEAEAYNNIGIVYSDQGNFTDALINHIASLKIQETIDCKKGIANSYNNIGNVYDAQNNYQEAIKNYSTCLKMMETIGDKAGIAASFVSIGNVNARQGNYQESLKNYFASLEIKESLGDKEGQANPYNNIGNVYFLEGKYGDALKNHFISLKIKESIGDKYGIAESYGNIGEIYFKQKEYKKADDYFLKAKDLSKEIGFKENLKNIYVNLTELDSTNGNFRRAYENHKLYILYRDSLDNEETRKKTIQTQMTYDFEKKESVTNAEHKKEVEKQNVVIMFVTGGLLFVFMFAGFIYRSLRVTRKQKNIIEQHKNSVEQQKQEVVNQKLIVEEKQKDIIDSITYAKRLQKAILPSDEEIKKYLPDSFILYKPKDIVAGDFYWLHTVQFEDLKPGQFENNKKTNHPIVFIAAADSTGHGVPGAMVSVVCSNALNRSVNEFKLTDPGKILDKTRELVLETFAKSGEEISDGMDISLLAINKEAKQIIWSGANNQLWYFQNNNFKEIKPNKQAIGKTDNPKPFSSYTIEMQCGDTFYLMTDGFADQFGGDKGKKYKYKQLQAMLIANNRLPLAAQKEKLSNCFNDWKGNLEQVDDVTIIGIRI